jgi:predicted ATPase
MYLLKHPLVQDAAYGTLLREPRRALHARIADAIEEQFPEIAESQPKTLARHCTEAGQIEKAASLWGNANRRDFLRHGDSTSIERCSILSLATFLIQPTLSFAPTVFAGLIPRWRASLLTAAPPSVLP